MDELDRLLRLASERVVEDFIYFPVDGGDREIRVYRERVYCYELYHQMRCEWDEVCNGYTLNGEVDKVGHRLLSREGIKGGIPDLLVHKPGLGGMAFNYAVIEVKGPRVTDRGIQSDVKKLDKFVRLGRYSRAIFLIYASGEGRDESWIERVARIVDANVIQTRIEVWLHRAAYSAAECVCVIRRP